MDLQLKTFVCKYPSMFIMVKYEDIYTVSGFLSTGFTEIRSINLLIKNTNGTM